MKVKSVMALLLLLLCSGCSNSGGDIMKLVTERDSLKSQIESQGNELKMANATVSAINNALDSIAIQEGLIFVGESREIPVSRNMALANLKRFETVVSHQRENIRVLEEQLKNKKGDSGLLKMIEHLKKQLQEKDSEIAMLRQELSRKDANIEQLKKIVDSQRTQIAEQVEAISQLDQRSKAQTKALANQDKYINSSYVMIGTRDDLKRKGIVKGSRLLSEGLLDKSKFAKVDVRVFKEISFEAKRPRILTSMPPSSYTLTTNAKNHFTLYITNVSAFWSVSNFLVIQTN